MDRPRYHPGAERHSREHLDGIGSVFVERLLELRNRLFGLERAKCGAAAFLT
jgi:hypothetical protein